MDNGKMPFLPEETLQIQRVEVYFSDLKARLKALRLQHDEVIQNSVDILQEIDKVSSSLLLQNVSGSEHDNAANGIKKLIQGFESNKDISTSKNKVTIEGKVDIQKILYNFEKLNESHMLKESLVLFKKAKESFERIDTFLCRLNKSESCVAGNKNTMSNALKNKINMFNGCIEPKRDIQPGSGQSHYASCSSSAMSLETYHSAEELRNEQLKGDASIATSENGYEGDNDDSEYDLLAQQRKKEKHLPTNN